MILATDLQCEHLTGPVGVDVAAPRFSWKLEGKGQDIIQKAYQIQVAADQDFASLLWDTGMVHSDQSILVPYGGEKLSPSTRYYFRVKVETSAGVCGWSAVASFMTGLLGTPWQAKMITGQTAKETENYAGTNFRREFSVDKPIAFAMAYATAKGVYELHINGQRVGDWVMTPGWTEYRHRILVQAYDVTRFVRSGVNALGAMVGPGWFKSGMSGRDGAIRKLWDLRTGLTAQFLIRYEDGSEQWIGTDDTWEVGGSPVTYSDIYQGERYDARLEQDGWDMPGFSAGWKKAMVMPFDASLLKAQDGLPIRRQERLAVVEEIHTPAGETVFDFGQNLTGWVRIAVKGKAGDTVRLRHAEILDENGNFYTGNLRSAKQEIVYTLRGGQEEIYEPVFTFQGFRYIRVEEFPGTPTKDNFTAIVVHSDLRPIGALTTSHEMLNQLEKNIRWGMKGNFLDVPTDCPQRNERLGWTGDAQAFARAASMLMDTAPFFRKWLRDLRAAQFANGGIPHVVPDVLTLIMNPKEQFYQSNHSSSGWGDAAVICPWMVYRYSGDEDLLREQYPSMKAWIGFIRSRAQDGVLWNSGFHYGDWLGLDAKEGSYRGATPNDLVATAYYAYSTSLVAQTARILGETQDAEYYEKLHMDIRDGFCREFYTPNGRLAANTQTAHVHALMFDLVRPEHRERTVNDLVTLIRESGNHLTTGFLGTPYLCHVLSENGRLDVAYELLLREEYPSWLYPITKGATTIWEHWDGIKPDNTRWSDDMNSFNHYAYGAVADWMYSVIGGIDTAPDAPAYKHSIIKPRPGGGITNAHVRMDTPYGLLEVTWQLTEGIMETEVTIPHNTTATLMLPGQKDLILGSGTWHFTSNQ